MMAIVYNIAIAANAAQHSMEPARPRAANHCAHPTIIRSAQLWYARQESSRRKWKFIAIRENGRKAVAASMTAETVKIGATEPATEECPQPSSSTNMPANLRRNHPREITPEFVRRKSRAAAPLFRKHQSIPESEPMIHRQ